MCQFLNSIAFLLDFTLPYRLPLRELAVWNRWSTDLFSTDMFRLNANVMTLCAAFGLKNDVLAVQNPFNNLHLLIQELQKSKVCPNELQLINLCLVVHNSRTFNGANETKIGGCFQAVQIRRAPTRIQFRTCELRSNLNN
jgi:hypothetical protein